MRTSESACMAAVPVQLDWHQDGGVIQRLARPDRRLFAPWRPMLAGSGGAQIIYSAVGYKSAPPRRCGISAQSAASGF
jgi:hypothetical protein